MRLYRLAFAVVAAATSVVLPSSASAVATTTFLRDPSCTDDA